MIQALQARLSLLFATIAGRAVLPLYAPSAVSPAGGKQAEMLERAYEAAVEDGYVAMRRLMKEGPKLPPSKNGSRLTSADMSGNVLNVSTRLLEAMKSADPDTLAAEMVEMLCIGVPGMKELDNRRRIVSTWSAVLAPSVVVREKWDTPITIADIVDCAIDWVQFGYTDAAKRTTQSRDTRFIAKHPARAYELVFDSAHSAGVDHDKLVATLIAPVLTSLGNHVGAVRAAHEPVEEKA